MLAALAGVRSGDAVAVVGDDPVLLRTLLAGSGVEQAAPGEPVRVAVATAAYDVPVAVAMLAPGGRLVAVAADRGAATRTAALHGLTLQHVEPVLGRVAWSARRPLDG